MGFNLFQPDTWSVSSIEASLQGGIDKVSRLPGGLSAEDLLDRATDWGSGSLGGEFLTELEGLNLKEEVTEVIEGVKDYPDMIAEYLQAAEGRESGAGGVVANIIDETDDPLNVIDAVLGDEGIADQIGVTGAIEDIDAFTSPGGDVTIGGTAGTGGVVSTGGILPPVTTSGGITTTGGGTTGPTGAVTTVAPTTALLPTADASLEIPALPTNQPLNPSGNIPMPNITTLGVDTSLPEQRQTDTTQTQVTGTSGVETGATATGGLNEATSFLDAMDPASRQAFEDLLTQTTAGGSDFQQTQMTALTDTINRLGVDADQYSFDNAVSMAQGNVDELTQELMNNILPGIMGQATGQGASEDAIAQLLGQNAAARTGEAQQRAILQAVVDFGKLSQSGAQVTGQLATAQDPVTAQLMDLLGIGKGSQEAGETTETTQTLEQTQSSTDMIQRLVNELFSQTAGTTGAFVPAAPDYTWGASFSSPDSYTPPGN